MVSFDLRKLFRVPDTQQRLGGLNLRKDLQRAAGQMASDARSDVHLKPLGDLLAESETVLRIVEGIRSGQMGFLVLTTANVLFRAHNAAAGLGDVVPLSTVLEVTDRARGMTGGVRIQTTDGLLDVDKILGSQAAQFAQDLRGQLRTPGQLPPDPVAELVKLREQHAAGLIDAAEFRKAKTRLLDDL